MPQIFFNTNKLFTNERMGLSIVGGSDNFSFQNNGIKKCTCWKTMVLSSNYFNTTSHMIYFDYKAYAFY